MCSTPNQFWTTTSGRSTTASSQYRAKDTFLQNVSHELRTPLTAILGFAELLADPSRELTPAEVGEFHQRILTQSQRLQQLLDDLLDLDRFAHGRIEPHWLPTDLIALIERIVANLLHNIVRHTPPDARVWVRTRSTPEGIELTVDDDGPGIPEADSPAGGTRMIVTLAHAARILLRLGPTVR